MADTASTSSTRNRRFSAKNSGNWLFFVGDWRWLTKFLMKKTYQSAWAPLKFIDALLRGYGQVIFANNPISGLLIVIVLTIADPEVSLAGFITAVIGLVTSIFMKQDPLSISTGLTVYNPLLVGLITSSVLPTRFHIDLDPFIWIFMLIAAITVVYVTSAVTHILGYLGKYPVPCFTMPFNIVQLILFLCVVNMRPYYNNNAVANNFTLASQDVITKPLQTREDILTSNSYPSVNTELFQLTPDHVDEDKPRFSRNFFGNSRNVKVPNKPAETLHKVSDEHTSSVGITQAPTKSVIMDFDFTKREDSPHTYTSTPTTVKEVTSEPPSDTTVFLRDNLSTTELPTTIFNDVTSKTTWMSTPYITVQNFETNTEKEMKNNFVTVNINKENETYHNMSDYLSIFDWTTESTESTSIPYVYSKLLSTLSTLMYFETDDSSETFSDFTTPVTDSTVNDNLALENETIFRPVRSLSENETLLDANITNGMEKDPYYVHWGQVFEGIILSMCQVYGYSDAPAAVTMYLAVLIYSPTTTAFALTGATLGSLTGLVLGDAPYTSVYLGHWGYNGLLTASVLGGYCYVLTIHSAAAAIIGAVFSTAIQHVFVTTFAKASLTPMSLPFNLGAMLFLYVMSHSSSAFSRPESITFPEKHYFEHRKGRRRQKNASSRSASVTSLEKSTDAEKRAPLARMDDL